MDNRGMRLDVVALVIACVGCTTTPNPRSCLDHHCSDPAFPFCDETGAISGTAGICVAVSCEAGTFKECRDDAALVCNDQGTSYDMVQCPYGCGASGCLPCNTTDCETHLIPRFAPDVCTDLSSIASREYLDDTEINSSDDANCTEIITQPPGPEICVIRASTIRIATNRTLKVRGSRAIALVADRELDIEGILDISADATVNGPGGGLVKSGASSNQAGGGAGYRTAGGAGASDSGDGGSSNGGAPGSSPLLLATLNGGAQPAAAPTASQPGGAGGAGLLVSCRATVSISGTLDAGGGGGVGDFGDSQPPYATYIAAGGGTGGTIVIAGLAVTISGQVYANGGGGGGGGVPGFAGMDGQRSTSAALGGPQGGFNSGGGPGGNGGALDAPLHGGRPIGVSNCGLGCGAGGGSAGYVVVLTPTGAAPQLAPLAASPMLDVGNVPISQ